MIISKTLKEYLAHFEKVFITFVNVEICIKLVKVFIDYLFIELLNEHVNFMKLIIFKNKIRVIIMFIFLYFL